MLASKWFHAVSLVGFAMASATAGAVTLDFETEDDFATPLVNGQIIDAAYDAVDLEFGNLVVISSRIIGSDGHLGVTVFDSDAADQPADIQDKDLLVGTGNILILQNDGNAVTALGVNGKQYTKPNDEADYDDRGAIVFDFLSPSYLQSIDLIDINGGSGVVLTLTDTAGKTRVYDVPQRWTTDVTVNLVGWQTLDLTTLLPQAAEPLATGGDATATEDAGFNPFAVVQLDVAFNGHVGHSNPTPSGAIDNLVFIPEPGTALLAGLAGLAMIARRR